MNSYIIFGHDNDKYAYKQNNVVSCPTCNLVDRHSSIKESFKKLKYDISSTLDNELLISKKVYKALKLVIDESNFEKAGEYFYIKPEATVQFNHLKRGTKFGEKCETCQTHSYVIGVTPCILKEPLMKSGLYKTNLSFGDKQDYGSNLTPAIIVTEDLLNIMLDLKATGLDYEENKY